MGGVLEVEGREGFEVEGGWGMVVEKGRERWRREEDEWHGGRSLVGGVFSGGRSLVGGVSKVVGGF